VRAPVSARAPEETTARKKQNTIELEKNDVPPLQPHFNDEWEFLHITRVLATKLACDMQNVRCDELSLFAVDFVRIEQPLGIDE
jgi:hypothetical protein